MYGTIFRTKVKAGHEAHVVDLFKEWEATNRRQAKGAMAGLLLKPDTDSGELVGVAVFGDQAAYRANADAPEQDRWYRRLREHLDADPAWEDGEYVAGGVA